MKKGSAISSDIAGIYEHLEPRPGAKKKFLQHLQEFLRSPISIGVIVTVVISTVARIAVESPSNGGEIIRIVLDNLVGWAGSHIDNLELATIIFGFATAILWVLLPPRVYESIARREAVRARSAEKYREGGANLAGKLGPNVHIDVGKSDPAALSLIQMLHRANTEVVTFLDEENPYFSENHYWQKTNNDWTNREILTRGDIQEMLASVVLVSNGDDVFLSARTQSTTQLVEDMTDNEAIGTINARDTVRKQMGLPPTRHVLVTNPKRTVEIGVVRSDNTFHEPKTVGQVIAEKYPHVHLVDPDTLVIEAIAAMASAYHLPVELVTKKEKKEEYQVFFNEVVTEHAQKVDAGLTKNKVKIAQAKDSKNTLSILYGSNDEDTITYVETYREEFSKKGKLVAIINDPEKAVRLSKGVQFICVGTLVAEEIFQNLASSLDAGERA